MVDILNPKCIAFCTGVKMLYDYYILIAVNTCGTPRDDCHEHATCTDVGSGSYTCTCNEGYTGNGKNCVGKNLHKKYTQIRTLKKEKMHTLKHIVL